MARLMLQKQLRELMGKRDELPDLYFALVDDGNLFLWNVGIAVRDSETASPYHGGFFLAELKFPLNYPFMPPVFTFKRDFFHPNVYKDRRVCISILHPPGEDEMSGEQASERWNPMHSVESICLSVLSLIHDPNTSSPANVDAGVLWDKNREGFDRIVRLQVEQSKHDIPPDFVMPSDASSKTHPKVLLEPLSTEDFWCASDYDSFDEEEEEEDSEDMEADEGMKFDEDSGCETAITETESASAS